VADPNGAEAISVTAKASGVKSAGYRWYLAAQVLSLFGTIMSYTALFWLVLHIRYGGAPALAAVDAALSLPMLLFSRRAGTIVTRHRAARVAMTTQGLEAAGSLAIGFPLLAGWMSVWYLLPLCFVLGCVQTVDLPARQTFMLDLVGQGELRRGTSLFATVTGLARIAAPGVAGIVIAFSGETAVFFVDAASFLGVIAVLGWAARNTETKHTPTKAANTRRWLLDLPRGVQAAVAMALLVGGFGMQFAVTNPLMASRVFHLGSVGFGLFGTSIAVGGIAGNFYSSRRKDPSRSEFLAWALLFGVGEAMAAVMPAVWAYDMTMAVVGAATQLFAVSATVYVQQNTPAAQRGQALSAYNAGFIGFVPAGAFVVAAIASTAGTRWALTGPGLAIALCAGTMLISRHQDPFRKISPVQNTRQLRPSNEHLGLSAPDTGVPGVPPRGGSSPGETRISVRQDDIEARFHYVSPVQKH
jgi:MFS family permease